MKKKKLIIAGNWKMNLNAKEALELAEKVSMDASILDKLDVILFPSFIYIPLVAQVIKSKKIGLGGQDICFNQKGAYTGEVAAFQLKGVGCTHTLIGHSERRHYFHEDYETVNKKMYLALSENLKVILCVGETSEERKKGIIEMVVVDQLESAFQNISLKDTRKISIAYEPIWAIGTGKTATAEDVSHVHQLIRKTLARMYNKSVSSNIRILYGGSIKPDNIKSFTAQDEIDGALVGGASLDADSFLSLIKNSLETIESS